MSETASMEPTKATQISNAMEQLSKAIESVGQQSKHLSDRIKSVLRPESPKPPASESPQKVSEQVQLAARLSGMIEDLERTARNIDDTEKRVEL